MKRVVFALISTFLILLITVSAPATARKSYTLPVIRHTEKGFPSFNFSSVNKTELFMMIVFTVMSIISMKVAMDIIHQPNLAIEDILDTLLLICLSLEFMIPAMAAFILILEDLGIDILSESDAN